MEQAKEEKITSIEFEFNNEELICFYELDIGHNHDYRIIIEDIRNNKIVAGGMLSTHYLTNAIFINLDVSLNTERYYNENDEDGKGKYQLSKFKRIAEISDVASITINTENNSYTYVVPWIGEQNPDSKNPCQQSYITNDGSLYLAIAYDKDKCSWWVDEIKLKETINNKNHSA